MKSMLLGLAILLGACSIQHRSDAYACTKQADCNNGRTCTDGFCVVPGAGIDAPHLDSAVHDDGTSCPSGCSTCNVTQKTCTIDCRSANCSSAVVCPLGYKCEIECNTDNACAHGVDCTGALSCNITCSASGSCKNVECGIGPCDVACSGSNSCRMVSCNSSCACDVTCTGSQSCGNSVACTSLACISGLGCTSVPSVCHSCP